MKLKYKVADLDSVPEHLRSLYTEQEDGTFVLDVDDTGYKETLSKLRDEKRTEVKARKEIEEKLAAYGDYTPEEIEEFAKAKRAIEEKKFVESGDIDALVEKRIEPVRKDLENKIKVKEDLITQLTNERDSFKVKYSDNVIMNSLTEAIHEVGVPKNKHALQDLLRRGKDLFVVNENGVIEARDSNGDIVFGKSGTGLTAVEWAEKASADYSYLFSESVGGGARGSIQTGNGKTISKSEISKMSPSQKLSAHYNA